MGPKADQRWLGLEDRGGNETRGTGEFGRGDENILYPNRSGGYTTVYSG